MLLLLATRMRVWSELYINIPVGYSNLRGEKTVYLRSSRTAGRCIKISAKIDLHTSLIFLKHCSLHQNKLSTSSSDDNSLVYCDI